LFLGHRNLIKKITQTAVINIVFKRIFIELDVSCASQHTFSKVTVTIFWFQIGDQAALHNLIKRGEIEIAKIQEYTAGELKEFCKTCKIPYSGKSQVN